MRQIALVLALALNAFAHAEAGSPSGFDWKPWRSLPVQDGGRYKPVDTAAWETLRMLCNRASFVHPSTGEKLDATGTYLSMLFDWRGWETSSDPQLASLMEHSSVHQPDAWDQAPLLRIDSFELRRALGFNLDQKYFSPHDVSRANIHDPISGKQTPFMLWADKVSRRREEGLSSLERSGAELANLVWAYQDHRAGKRLGLIPVPNSQHEQWLSLSDLVRTKWDEGTDPGGALRRAQADFEKVRKAYLGGSADEFREASSAFIATLQEIGPRRGSYPSASTIGLEVAYNHWVPFRFAWFLTMLAFAAMLLSLGTGWRWIYATGLAAFGLAFLAMLCGFILRSVISGRAPITNMYESVVYLALGTAVFGLIFEALYPKRFILAAAAAVATIALILADNCPAVLDPSLRPLQPVLRSNFWLVTHVMSITLSYAAFALAMGIGNVTLGYFLMDAHRPEMLAALTRFTYRSLQVGVLLLAIGTVLGGVWAAYSWGRFWGWDPKEVWALIALLGYLAVLHARYVAWVRELGLAVLSVLCFLLIVMAWYGVNYVLGAGLHSYGFGGGGQSYVTAVIAVQLGYLGIALAAHARRQANSVAITAQETA